MKRRFSYANKLLAQLVITAVAVLVSLVSSGDWLPGLPIGVLLGLLVVALMEASNRRNGK